MARMTPDDLLARIRSLRVWKRGDQRAPHKPLLLLWALARVRDGSPATFAFDEVAPALQDLLVAFGPPRQTHHPEFPFWYLQSDGVWDVTGADDLRAGLKPGREPSKRALRDAGARGGLPADVRALLAQTPDLVDDIARALLGAHFPSSMHEDILDRVGLAWAVGLKRPRDRAFRDHVLRAYEHRCALCGYDGRLGTAHLALEAAHVKWHAAGGPDAVDNGLALCAFHHRAFDRGALGMDADRRILVSQDVNGAHGIDALLLRHAGQPMRAPQAGNPPVDAAFIAWHKREVFRGPARVA